MRGDWLGPLFHYELLRQARKPRLFLLKALLPLLLLVLLGLFAANWQEGGLLELLSSPDLRIPDSKLAVFTERIAIGVLILQGIALLLITPALVGGSIAEDRQRRTLDLLFTTHLTNWEILAGKLGSRLAVLLSVWLAGLPVLALLQLWGGISLMHVAAGFLGTIIPVFLFSCISLFASTDQPTVPKAIGYSYVLTIGFSAFAFCAIQPIALMYMGSGRAGWGLQLTIIPVLLGAFFLYLARGKLRVEKRDLRQAAELRPRRRPQPIPVAPTAVPEEGEEAPLAAQLVSARELDATSRDKPPPTAAVVRHRRQQYLLDPAVELRRPAPTLPPVTDHPLVWIETCLGVGIQSRFDRTALGCSFGLLFVLGLLVLALATSMQSSMEGGFFAALAIFAHLPRFLLCLYLLFLMGSLLFFSARSIVGEREQDTWVNLLLLPYTRTELLGGKWQGILLRHRPLVLSAYIAAWVGVAGLLFHPFSCLLFSLLLASQIALVVSLGLAISRWVGSAVAGNFLAGSVLVVAIMIFFVFLPFQGGAFASQLQREGDASRFAAEVVTGLVNPIQSWWNCLRPWDDWLRGEVGWSRVAAPLVATVLNGTAAWVLFRQTAARLRA